MNRRLGILFIVISAASFGTLAILGRYAYAEGMDVYTILFLRFILAGALMAVLLAARRERLPVGADLLRLVGMGAIGYVGQSFSYFSALKYASAGLVALLLYLYPAFVALLSAIFLRERILPIKWLALALALVGTALTVGPAGGQLAGILLAISAAAIYSVYIIVGAGVMKRVSAFQSSAVIFAAAGVTYGGLSFASGPHFPVTLTGWAVIFALVIIATIVPVVTFLAGLERLGPTNAAMFSTLEPVVTVLLAAVLLNERLAPVTLLGGGLILLAVLLLSHSELRQAAVPPFHE
ncbi:MAG: EamA family transporter [Anaerolineales bacterium]|nr:EamA family transporter [Anaerolineales bacterium]